MTLDEIRDLCSESTPDDWHTIDCWSADAGPAYLDELGPAYLDEWVDGDHRFHTRRAVLRSDVTVGLAWGLTVTDSHAPEWTSPHWNPNPGPVQIVETFFQGVLVDREHYALVDSGRAKLPLPVYDPISEALHSEGLSDYTITPHQYRLFLLLDELDGGSPEGEGPGDYLRQAGFRLEGGGDRWME